MVFSGVVNSRSRGQMLDCRCYGQHSHQNESRTEIRLEPYLYELFSSKIRPARTSGTVRVLCKTRLIFPRINGPSMCGYTGHFFIYHGKWPFYRGKLPRCVWPDFPEINLPWEISMVTSKIAKKPLITLNLVKSKGFSIPKAKQPIRFHQHETPQNCFF